MTWSMFRHGKKIAILILLLMVPLTFYSWKSSASMVSSDDLQSLQSDTPKSSLISSTTHPSTIHQLGSPHLSANDSELETASPVPPVSNRTILQDLNRCSRALGITEQSLLKNRANIIEVSRRAKLFLEKIASLLPGHFLKGYKNPCWMAKEPIAGPGWENTLMKYFHPQYGKKPHRRGDRLAHLLSTPVDEEYTKSKRLFCLPYFFLAGFPKCGSTTVHDAFGMHPEIIQPSEKEPHYWARALKLGKSKDFDAEYISLSFMTYTLFFTDLSSRLMVSSDPNTALGLITNDGSQSTLWDSNFFYRGQEYCAMPAVISRVLPNAKFIVVMRNPVTRLYSHFMYSCQFNYGGDVAKWPRPIRENATKIFHIEAMKEVENFNKCLKRRSLFECVNTYTTTPTTPVIIEGIEFKKFHRLTIGLYAVHILKWLQFYPKENFLFLRTEDLSRTPTEIMSKITEFLGVSPVSEQMARAMFRKPHNVFDTGTHHLLPMDEQTRLSLEEFYRPYNEELARITNDDRFLWITTS